VGYSVSSASRRESKVRPRECGGSRLLLHAYLPSLGSTLTSIPVNHHYPVASVICPRNPQSEPLPSSHSPTQPSLLDLPCDNPPFETPWRTRRPFLPLPHLRRRLEVGRGRTKLHLVLELRRSPRVSSCRGKPFSFPRSTPHHTEQKTLKQDQRSKKENAVLLLIRSGTSSGTLITSESAYGERRPPLSTINTCPLLLLERQTAHHRCCFVAYSPLILRPQIHQGLLEPLEDRRPVRSLPFPSSFRVLLDERPHLRLLFISLSRHVFSNSRPPSFVPYS
jgi:hypothetical protein